MSRAPGGDPTVYQTSCRFCHQLLGPLRAAWAWHNFDINRGAPEYTPNVITRKINQTIEYREGAMLSSNTFQNRVTLNQNTQFGWRGALSGTGARGFGQMIAQADRFASCAVWQVFTQLCRRPPNSSELANELSTITAQFRADDYNLRNVFKRIAILPQCLGSL